MRVTLPNESQSLTRAWNLSVSLRLSMDGPEVTREPVNDADLAEALSEAWFAGCLRKGHLDLSWEEVPARLIPVPENSGATCTGFAIEVTHPGGEAHRQEFNLKCLQSVASRAAQRLVTEGTLQSLGLYFFRLLAEIRPPGRVFATMGTAPFVMAARSEPLVALKVPLGCLLNQAEPVGVNTRDTYPVFYTEQAFARAEYYARLGAASQPAVETGAVLVGSLCSCPETLEMFAVVCDALEAQDAEQTPFSLFYSSQSWARIQAIMRARRSRPATRSQLILGNAHGHNFRPSSEPPCETCEKVRDCNRTSVFVSADDHSWSRAVFHRQPWQLCHIFGLTARGEPAHSLFGLSGGSLVARDFHVIPGFDSAAWPLAEADP